MHGFDVFDAVSVAKLALKFQDRCVLRLQLDFEIFGVIWIRSRAQVRVYDLGNSLSSWAAYSSESGFIVGFVIMGIRAC